MRNDRGGNATKQRTFWSLWWPVLKVILTVFVVVFAIPTLLGFGILYYREHKFSKLYPPQPVADSGHVAVPR